MAETKTKTQGYCVWWRWPDNRSWQLLEDMLGTGLPSQDSKKELQQNAQQAICLAPLASDYHLGLKTPFS